jgi:hypothetical protein
MSVTMRGDFVEANKTLSLTTTPTCAGGDGGHRDFESTKPSITVTEQRDDA